MLKGAIDVVKGRAGLSVVPGFLRPIDTEVIARRERVEEKGAENGQAGLPDTSAQYPDAPEQAITQSIQSEWSWQGGALLNELRAYGSRLAQYSIHSEHARLRLLAQSTLAALRAPAVRAPAELGPLKEDYRAARREVERFQARHRLERPARDKSRRWTAFGLMFVLVAIESVMNGLFFAKGNQGGLIGGIGTAIGISITNVISGFLLGLGPARWLNHRNILLKITGLALLLAGVALLIVLHIFAAQFRDATGVLIGDERAAFALAVERLRQAPWRVTSINSIYLFGLGMLFTLGALWKGVTFDDPYPGYGAAQRRLASARDDYSDQHASLFDELEDIKDDAVRQLASGIKQVPLFPQHAENVRMQRSALLESFRAYESSIEAAANQVLSRYRTANRRTRKTPPPAYFDEVWKLPYRIADSEDVRQLLADVATPSIEPVLADFRSLSEEVLSEYDKLIKQYPHPTDMVETAASDGQTQQT
jgi:hypothetical protein